MGVRQSMTKVMAVPRSISNLFRPVTAYTHWLHTRWPAGGVEKLPVVADDGSTNVPGLYVVGDLAGVPLLKLSINGGTRVVQQITEDPAFARRSHDVNVLDVAIVGGGTAGFAAAKEAQRLGLRYCVFEASEPFSTIVNFPKRKPIYTYPTQTPIEGQLQLHEKSAVKEGLLEDLREQTVGQSLTWRRAKVDHVRRRHGGFDIAVEGDQPVRAHRVIVAIGRSGNYRRLGVPGEDIGKVTNRLHDPEDYRGQDVVVVGGGDSALETAIALVDAGARVTLSYRGTEFSRPKPDNVEKLQALQSSGKEVRELEAPSDHRQSTTTGSWMSQNGRRGGSLCVLMRSQVSAVDSDSVRIDLSDGESTTLANDSVFVMIGREAPLDFFRRSGVRIAGERNAWWWSTLVAFLIFCFWLYHWKSPYTLPTGLQLPAWLALDPGDVWARIRETGGGYFNDPATLGGTLAISASSASFYYTFAYSVIVVVFGIRRIRRRRTPYVTWQTVTLAIIQVMPLFLLPEIILPWLGHNDAWDSGAWRWLADTLFPEVTYGHGREYWRAYGLILAWPLMVWNWFTAEPLWGWLILGGVQTFLVIPAMIYFWGKGAYCGWICSCGALAETLGDTQRHKMPHGPGWNRLNMLGQGLLLFAVVLMVLRAVGWAGVGWAEAGFDYLADQSNRAVPFFNWAWLVDVMLAGILGVGLYFWFSGRVWCRFACPLAALMHIYHRFSRFRILADKSKCISCNVCTTVCHQGIDVMSFANKGEPMADPQCVRCSACVQSCPTGVLSFGQVDQDGRVIRQDPAWLAASPVRMRETQLTVNGKRT